MKILRVHVIRFDLRKGRETLPSCCVYIDKLSFAHIHI